MKICISVIQKGDSPLMLALRYGRTDIAKELLRSRGDLDLQNNVKSLLSMSILFLSTDWF